ncbi:MAG TPA: hypothetical protein VGN17_21385 [Bryobacteraceae bacterium]|jgi:hypothetical protein
MTEKSHHARWVKVVYGTLLTIVFALLLFWLARRHGRTILFAFGINWILIFWAIWLSQILESQSGARDGLTIQLPSAYYTTRPFENGGRLYDYFGVRQYRRLLRPVLWSVNPSLLRSQPDSRQTDSRQTDSRQAMMRATQHPEAGHLVIFLLVLAMTLWTLARGWYDTAAWLTFFNLLHNGYPVISMRQIRARLQTRGGTSSPALAPPHDATRLNALK